MGHVALVVKMKKEWQKTTKERDCVEYIGIRGRLILNQLLEQ